MRTLLLALASLVAGCGAGPHVAADGTPLVDGFDPTPPAANQIQVITPIFPGIKAGTDVTYCSYLDFSAPKTLDVTSYLGFQSRGGHHTILYATRMRQTPNTHECNDSDMINVKYIGGGGTDATISAAQIPPGIVFRIPQGAQLMMVSHWINATGQTVDGQAAYNITVQDPSPSVDPGDLFTDLTTTFNIPPGGGAAHTECTVGQDLSFFTIGGHAHEYANHITISVVPAAGGAATTIYDQPWTKDLVFATPLKSFTKDAPFTMKQGDKMVVDCTYDNPTGSAISFPTEMCVGFGYYFPANAEIDCIDGSWPTM